MNNILIFGGSGFIGRHLIKELIDNYNITVASRNPDEQKHLFPDNVQLVKIDYSNFEQLVPYFDKANIIINLAGENVGSRWNDKKKQSIKNSRLNTDKLIVEAFHSCTNKPSTIIQGSGMGVYGFEDSEITFTENSPLGTKGFLTEVGIAHEESLSSLSGQTRLVFLRTGLVLDGEEGALPPMAMPFKFFGGGPVGNGKQWNSWIHIKDEVKAIRFLLEDKEKSGAYNLTAPQPVRNKTFAKSLGKALNRPSFFPAPAFILQASMGEMADELLLSGLKIIPEKLLDAGFKFQFESLDDALKDIYP